MNTTEPQSEAPDARAIPSVAASEPGAGAASSPPPAPPAQRRPWPALLLWLLLLALLGAATYGGWRLWQFQLELVEVVEAQERLLQRLGRQMTGIETEAEQAGSRHGDLAQAQQRLSVELAELRARLEEGEQATAQLNDAVHGGRRRYQLLAIEQLLLAAHDRLLLAKDVGGAQKALEIAEQRLAALAEPQLFKLREAIAAERVALAAVPRVEVSTLALTLGELIARAPALPLATEARTHFRSPRAQDAAPAEDSGWWQRSWRKLREALSAMFILRREDGVEAQLLPEEHEALVRQILLLRLESARFALLRGEARSFRDALQQAEQWLARYYRGSDPQVAGMRGELTRLAEVDLAPELPDLSRSLTLLRAQLDATPR